MAEPTLRKGRISFFLPPGHDKAHDTKVTVNVGVKSDNQADLEIARKEGFAGTEGWKDDGQHTYTYELDVVSVGLTQIDGDVKTSIAIQPDKNHPVKFDYKLTLYFDDGDPDTAEIKLIQTRSGILLDENHRTFDSWRIFTRFESSVHAGYSVGECDW